MLRIACRKTGIQGMRVSERKKKTWDEKKNTERFIQNKTKINKRSASTVKNIFCIIIFGECVLFLFACSTYALLLIAQAKPPKKKWIQP